MKIIISPYSQKLRGEHHVRENPKNYPHWPELVFLLQKDGHEITQIGLPGEKPLVEKFVYKEIPHLKKMIKEFDTFISVDNFFPHFAHCYGFHGIVLFGRSDPKIFGYKKNVNPYGADKYLRTDQFGLWESCERIPEAFVAPQTVVRLLDLVEKNGCNQGHNNLPSGFKVIR